MEISQLLIITIVMIVFDWVFLTIVTVLITQRRKVIKEDSFFNKVSERLSKLELRADKDKSATEGLIVKSVSSLLSNKFKSQDLRLNYLSLMNELNGLSEAKSRNDLLDNIKRLESKILVLKNEGQWTLPLKQEVIEKIGLIASLNREQHELYELLRLEKERISELRTLD